MNAEQDLNQSPRVSVVLLNHRRPHLLARVLHGVAQLDYPSFEVVVVGDQSSIQAYDLPPEWARRIRYRQVTEPNICLSRNVGIAMSGGEIIAFIDDDAVPEPDWLSELVIPFQTKTVGAVAGSVRGSDGLHMEWTGGWFDRTGEETPTGPTDQIRIADSKTQITRSRFLALMGVNTAFRRDALVGAGGFDQAYQYYLDETDMALRLTRAGWSAAYVPSAQVHHLREENAARDALRTPRNLVQIAASKAFFCQRHLPPKDVASALTAFRERRVADLDPYIRLGVLRRTGRDALIGQLDQGLSEGVKRQSSLPLSGSDPIPEFQHFLPDGQQIPLRLVVVSGWGIGPIGRARNAARRLAEAGYSVTCISYMSGPLPISVGFDRGVWMHRGGTWQFMDLWRKGKPLSRAARAKAELDRIAVHRSFDLVLKFGRQSVSGQAQHSVKTRYGQISAHALALPQARLRDALHEITSVLSKNTKIEPTIPAARMPDPAQRPNLGASAYMGYAQPRTGGGTKTTETAFRALDMS